jgi:hypothetical protein
MNPSPMAEARRFPNPPQPPPSANKPEIRRRRKLDNPRGEIQPPSSANKTRIRRRRKLDNPRKGIKPPSSASESADRRADWRMDARIGVRMYGCTAKEAATTAGIYSQTRIRLEQRPPSDNAARPRILAVTTHKLKQSRLSGNPTLRAISLSGGFILQAISPVRQTHRHPTPPFTRSHPSPNQ